jgi:hypothetical protein
MILRKEDLNKLIDKISLRHEEKRELKLLLKKSLKMRLWSEIKDKVKKLKDRFKKEVAISKQKALLSLRKSAQNFEKSPPVE